MLLRGQLALRNGHRVFGHTSLAPHDAEDVIGDEVLLRLAGCANAIRCIARRGAFRGQQFCRVPLGGISYRKPMPVPTQARS